VKVGDGIVQGVACRLDGWGNPFLEFVDPETMWFVGLTTTLILLPRFHGVSPVREEGLIPDKPG
jgi:hypothetical protein